MKFMTTTAQRAKTISPAAEEETYYIFRSNFSEAIGNPRYRSSSMYFAPDDAKRAMESAVANAPVFIAAFYRACTEVADQFGQNSAPDVAIINQLLEKHRIGYVIDPPKLRLREEVDVVPITPTKLLKDANKKFAEAVERSEQLLQENKCDEAVTHIWWLLESISTAFSGLQVNGKPIKGEYLNDVMKSLQKANSGMLGMVARWVLALQAYLSGPHQGGIRHGLQLDREGLQKHEATLFFNLTRSYISYLLKEYERISSAV